MGATKYEIYSEEAIEIAELFKAFAHPARVMVVLRLLEANATATSITSLLEEIKLSQSSLSKHVEKLKNHGVLSTRMERRGTKCYQVLGINQDVMENFRKVVLKVVSLSLYKQSSVSKGYVRFSGSSALNNWLNTGIT